MKCIQCEYEAVCFPLLKFVQRFRDICQQRRKKKEYRQKQMTLPVSDTEVDVGIV